jgi:hypothetical protein
MTSTLHHNCVQLGVLLVLLLAWTPLAARLPDWHTLFSAAQPGNSIQHGWAVWDGSQISFSAHRPAGAAAPAYANYSVASSHVSGFGQLRVSTSPRFSNSVQMRAAGFVEGYLTAPQIADHAHNQHAWLLSKTQQVDRIHSW